MKSPNSDAIGGTRISARSKAPRDLELLAIVLTQLRSKLPPDWSINERQTAPRRRGARVDAVWRVLAPDGATGSISVEARARVDARDVSESLDQLAALTDGETLLGGNVRLLAAPYLSPEVRERIAERGAAYADATGNLRLAMTRPALFVHERGGDRDPWRGAGRPKDTLKGAPSARVVRALIDFAEGMTVPELARRSGASVGATYRVVELAEAEDLLEREPRGPIRSVRWRALLERWSRDYRLAPSGGDRQFLAARGLDDLLGRLRKAESLQYVVTGSLAARRSTEYAPARLAMLFVDDPAAAAEQLGLQEVETGGNVVLLRSDDNVAFERSVVDDSVRFAAPSQVAVDLLDGPGRNPSEGSALLDWMEAHVDTWRR